MANQSLIRFRKIRKAEDLDDTLSAAQISASPTTAVTEEDLQKGFLAQIRRIIFGDDFTKNWNTDFIGAGIATLEQVSMGRFKACLCLSTDSVGDFVYANGPTVGGIPQVTKVDVTDETTMPSIGVIVDKPMATACLVQTLGDLGGTVLIPGKRYFVGQNSQLSAAIPTASSGGYAMVQAVGSALDQSLLILHPSLDMIKRIG